VYGLYEVGTAKWSLEKDHGDDVLDHKMIKGSTWKKKEKNKNKLIKAKVSIGFCFILKTP
jgi:hypothetical protein